jgi:hypothetical protein
VHVVEVRDAQQGRDHHPDQPAFLVRVDRIVACADGAPQHAERQEQIERQFRQRGPDADTAHERRPQAAKHAQARHRHVAAEGIGDQIDLVPEADQRPDAVKLAERRAPGLEERLRRNHENAHDP